MSEKNRRSNSRKYAVAVIAGAAGLIGVVMAAAYYMDPEGEVVIGTIPEDEPFTGPDTTVTDPLAVPPEPADDPARLPNPFADEEQEEQDSFPSLSISIPESDQARQQVTIAGDGFTPNEQISIFIDQTAVETEQQIIMTDDTGAFSANVALPDEVDDDQEVTVTVTDESGKAASDIIAR